MDEARYFIALALVMVMPAGGLLWISIHPLIRFWRRVGVRMTWTLHILATALLAVAFYLLRKPLLRMDFGYHLPLLLAAIALVALSLVVRFFVLKDLNPKTLLGFPEIAPEKFPPHLVTTGIYARARHPRYMEICNGILAGALFSNYLASYAVALYTVLALRFVIFLEERELHDRFGAEYDAWAARVPRFVPHFQRHTR